MTAPYKQVVAGLVDEVEGDARAIGAVNNVVRTDDGRLIGFNSDAPGFRAGVELAMGRPLAGADVVVAGAGGAAHAVVYALPRRGRDAGHGRQPRPRTAATRSLERFARGRRRAVGPRRRSATRRSRDALGSADLAVNATTVGMIDPGMTIDVDAAAGRTRPSSTSSTSRPRRRCSRRPARAACAPRTARRCSSQQAAIAFERWTGVGGMADVMREAVAPLLADATVTA